MWNTKLKCKLSCHVGSRFRTLAEMELRTNCCMNYFTWRHTTEKHIKPSNSQFYSKLLSLSYKKVPQNTIFYDKRYYKFNEFVAYVNYMSYEIVHLFKQMAQNYV